MAHGEHPRPAETPSATRRQAAGEQAATQTALYPRVLGRVAWSALDPAVQRAHDAPSVMVGTGTFVVTRSPGWLSGLLLDVARVPAASGGTGVRVVVRPDGAGELWQRAFGGRPLTTRQHATSGGLLAERFGPFEFQFRLSAEDGALRFRQARQLFGLGPVRVPLPAWAAPHISAREGASSSPHQTAVAVRVTTSQGALLFAYAGTVRWAAADSERDQEAGTETGRQATISTEGHPA